MTLPRVLGRAAPTLPIRRAPPLPGLGIKVLPYIEIVNGNGKVESFSCGPSKISLLQAHTHMHTHTGTRRARVMPASSTPHPRLAGRAACSRLLVPCHGLSPVPPPRSPVPASARRDHGPTPYAVCVDSQEKLETHSS